VEIAPQELEGNSFHTDLHVYGRTSKPSLDYRRLLDSAFIYVEAT